MKRDVTLEKSIRDHQLIGGTFLLEYWSTESDFQTPKTSLLFRRNDSSRFAVQFEGLQSQDFSLEELTGTYIETIKCVEDETGGAMSLSPNDEWIEEIEERDRFVFRYKRAVILEISGGAAPKTRHPAWTPIPLENLSAVLEKEMEVLTKNDRVFWNLIQVTPSKWEEPTYGSDGGGFWVVGLAGNQVVWYNDIEDGFNLSKYESFGKIPVYSADQDSLFTIVTKLCRSDRNGKTVQKE